MVAPAKRWTRAEFDALPMDGRRYELVHGRLLVNGVPMRTGDLADVEPRMTPAPSVAHQRIVKRLAWAVDQYVLAQRIGELVIAPADVPLATGVVVQPDLFVVPLVAGRAPVRLDEPARLLLAVEIVSPSTARTDRGLKRRLYQEATVPECWIVDADARVVERWRPGDEQPERVATVLEWRPEGATEPLRLPLSRIFEESV